MGTTNTLDLNNRVTGLEKAIDGLTASDIMMSDGVTSVEEAVANIGSNTDLGDVQGSGTITLANSVYNYRFIQILIGYYSTGYPCYGQALLPVSTLAINPNIATSIALADEYISGRVDISFLSATSVKVVNTASDTLYTKVVGIA